LNLAHFEQLLCKQLEPTILHPSAMGSPTFLAGQSLGSPAGELPAASLRPRA